MLQPQVLAQERRFWLQIEQPDTEDKGCERTEEARGEEGLDLLHDQGACWSTASAPPGAYTCLRPATPPVKATHIPVGAAAEEPRRACCAQSSGSDPCVAHAHTGLQWRAVREASCAHGHGVEVSGKALWPGSCAKDANRRDGEPPVAPRLVPGANLSSSRDGNSRPLWATAAQRTTEASTPRRGAEKHHARRHHAQQHRVATTFWREQLVYCVCGPARPPQQGRCPRAIGWLIGVRCVPSGRAEMPIEAAHGAAAAARATLPAASSYPRTLPRPCRAPGATLRRRKRLLQRQRDHIAAIQPLIEIAEQYILPGHHSGFGATHSRKGVRRQFVKVWTGASFGPSSYV